VLGVLLSVFLRLILVRPFDGDLMYNVFLDILIMGT
jgi:hypothetical protein